MKTIFRISLCIETKRIYVRFWNQNTRIKDVINTSKSLDLEWNLKAFRNEKSISYENRYTEMVYEYEDGKDDYLSAAKDDDDIEKM